MANAQKYAQDTELARRVAEWQENIQPRLHDEVFTILLWSACIWVKACVERDRSMLIFTFEAIV